VCNIFPHVNRWLAKIPLVGAKSRFEAIQPDHLLSLLLKWGGHVSLKELKNHPEGVLLAETQAGSFLGKRVPTDDGKVELWPTNLILDIPRLDTYEASFAERNGQLQLIGQRERRTHNSWMHNNPNIKQGDGNKVLMHPHDAKHRQIKNKDVVKVSTQQGAVQLTVSLTDSIAAGVIAIPHGWGQQGKAMKRAAKLAGDNINKIIPGGQQHMEPASGQAIMLGHFVDVVKVEVTEQAISETEEAMI
jgi:formate dehydrogenase